NMEKKLLGLLLGLLFFTACSENETVTAPGFSFDTTDEIVLGDEENATTSFTFNSTLGWTATTDANWLTVSPSSGMGGSATITITVLSRNDTGYSRKADLTLTSGQVTEHLTIRQDFSNYIDAEKTSYAVDAQGGKLEIIFTTNINSENLLVNSPQDTEYWLTQSVERTRAGSTYSIPLTVLPNTQKESRVGYLFFTTMKA
ncbi:MAG: BACON domain-containing protein, partial [Paraprevotella sp.]|nr:BACON domain-containing protein [Paraprevotella sp.]